MLSDINGRGARAVAEALWNDETKWKQVMDNIGQGKRGWLDVAAALRPGTDGGASETLDESVFIALAHDPSGVLTLLEQRRFDTRFVCSSNIAIDYSVAKAREFIKERIDVLSRTSDSNLKSVRDQCVTQLRTALRSLEGSAE
jgi:hypothetical protein